MGSSILTYVTTPFRQPFAQFPGVFVGLAFLGILAGFGLGRLAGALRIRSLDKRLGDAKDQARRFEEDGRRFAELLGVTTNARAPLSRLSNDQLRTKTKAFVSALRSQVAAWEKEVEARLVAGPPPQLSAPTAREANGAWGQVVRRLQTESSTRLATYQDRFKADAVLLRTEISTRLQRPPERSAEAVTRVSTPVNLTAMAEVAGDLEALVKLLPDDREKSPRSPSGRRPVRGRP